MERKFDIPIPLDWQIALLKCKFVIRTLLPAYMVTSTYGIKIVTINAIGWRESHFEHKSGAGFCNHHV
ncbi:hypothetical protein HOLleu_09389 [Holothuria leucospilota]|uniref:Uncharacterized protein n=1 Tax=Holothuria leucospilota TaxID=206669 RepID=A0A9Q1HEX3_HOLLE|nr:hypothetical protein HOLleu_09389 [Holothuria leucospilota]